MSSLNIAFKIYVHIIIASIVKNDDKITMFNSFFAVQFKTEKNCLKSFTRLPTLRFDWKPVFFNCNKMFIELVWLVWINSFEEKKFRNFECKTCLENPPEDYMDQSGYHWQRILLSYPEKYARVKSSRKSGPAWASLDLNRLGQKEFY